MLLNSETMYSNNLLNSLSAVFVIIFLLVIVLLIALIIYLILYLKYNGIQHVFYRGYKIYYDYDLEKNYKIISLQNFIILTLKIKLLFLKVCSVFRRWKRK